MLIRKTIQSDSKFLDYQLFLAETMDSEKNCNSMTLSKFNECYIALQFVCVENYVR